MTKCQVEPVVQADEFDGLVGLGNSSRPGEEVRGTSHLLHRSENILADCESIFLVI